MVKLSYNSRLDLEGMKFGNLTVIGDTGLTTERGNQIVLVRDLDGEVSKVNVDFLIQGKTTGYKGSVEHKQQVEQMNEWMDEKYRVNGTDLRKLGTLDNELTGYAGVRFDHKIFKWKSSIDFKGKSGIGFKHFDDFRDAVLHRFYLEELYFNKELIANGLEPIKHEKEIHKNKYVREVESYYKDILNNKEYRNTVLSAKKFYGCNPPKGLNKSSSSNYTYFRPRINYLGKVIRLGHFKHEQDAINARKEAEEKYFKPLIQKYYTENKFTKGDN